MLVLRTEQYLSHSWRGRCSRATRGCSARLRPKRGDTVMQRMLGIAVLLVAWASFVQAQCPSPSTTTSSTSSTTTTGTATTTTFPTCSQFETHCGSACSGACVRHEPDKTLECVNTATCVIGPCSSDADCPSGSSCFSAQGTACCT